ncbi:MAG TPA: MaoC/PaaZ C-terminal domain-containing protein [Burkholderiales bacterium]|jgi:acyl dehydratase
MALNYERLMALKRDGDRFKYTDRETMLYAIGIGMGADPLNRDELPYVYENPAEHPALKTVPSMATVLARIPLLKDCGYDYTKVVHGEQHLTLHRPLPPEGELIASSRVTAAYDKGAGKGAVIYTEAVVKSAADGKPMFTLLGSTFARGDGGFGGPSGSGPQPHPIPDRKPDATATLQTRKDQALLYRLNGDRNPLHADPDLAKRVGFPVPILHGLCTYGIACRAILQTVAAYDPKRIAGFDVRFSAPVYPGEAIATDIWVDGRTVSFRCRIPERGDAVVINNGKCTLADR